MFLTYSELDQVYEGIRTVVGQAHRDMKQNIDASTEGMKKLDEVVKNISTIKYAFLLLEAFKLFQTYIGTKRILLAQPWRDLQRAS